MKTTLTTLNKIIPQPQNQSSVNRVIEEGEEFINKDFRKKGFATEDFDGEENTKHLRNGDTYKSKIVSLFSYDFYGPSLGELATGMQQIQKVNNSLNRFNTENINLNKIYASTTLYGDIITQIYSDKTAKGVWTYNAELGCICPKNLTDTINMIKFFKFRTDQIDTNESNENEESIDRTISNDSNFTITTNHITMKETSLGNYTPSESNGTLDIDLTIKPNEAIIKNINWYIVPNKATITQIYNNGNIYNYKLEPSELGNITIYPIINEGEGDIEYNFNIKGKAKTIVISKESKLSAKIESCTFSTINTSLNVIKEEGTDNYIPENYNYGTVTVNLICNDGTELYNIHWYTNKDNSIIRLNIPDTNSTSDDNLQIQTGGDISNNQSFTVEVHPLKPAENVEIWCVINEGYEDIEYNTKNEVSNIPTFNIIDNTPETPIIPDDPEEPELETFNIDNILWYFRYTPNVTEAQNIYNNPFNVIVSSNVNETTETNKLFKFNTYDNNLIVYPHKSYIPSTLNINDKFDIDEFMSNGCYEFDIYIVFKNNYENLGNIIENDINIQILYKGNTVTCSKDNNIIDWDDDLESHYPKIVWKYHENNPEGYIIWKIRYGYNCDMNFNPSKMTIKIKKGDEVKYTKNYIVYCWDMLIQNTFTNDYYRLVDFNGNNMKVGRDRQRLYNTHNDGRGLYDTDIFQGYYNEVDEGRRDINSLNNRPCLLTIYENQNIKYKNSLDDTEVISSTKGLSPTFKKGKENEGKLMDIVFSPSELQTINGVKYYFQNTLDDDNYMSFSNRTDTYSLNFYEDNYSADYKDTFYNYMIDNNCVWVRVFKKQQNGIWGFNDIPYFISVSCEKFTDYDQFLIKDIPICGAREILFINSTFENENESLIQPIFIYNNSDTTKQVQLKDNTGTLIEFNKTIYYTLQPHEILYLPMTNYLYLNCDMNKQPVTSITCTLNDAFSNNSGAVLREFDNYEDNIDSLLILYNQDSTTHILDTSDKQLQFNNYISENRKYGSIGSSKSCTFNEYCPIFEITKPSNTYEVQVYVFLHLIQPDISNENYVDINNDRYYIVKNINTLYIDLNIATDEDNIDISLYEMEFNNVVEKNPLTTGILLGSSSINIKYREDNPCATVKLKYLYLNVEYNINGHITNYVYEIDDENYTHNPDTLLYSNFYNKTISLNPINYNSNDWYEDGYKIKFKDNGSTQNLYICVSVPLTALKVRSVNNPSEDLDRNLIYLFRGDSPNSSTYDTLK